MSTMFFRAYAGFAPLSGEVGIISLFVPVHPSNLCFVVSSEAGNHSGLLSGTEGEVMIVSHPYYTRVSSPISSKSLDRNTSMSLTSLTVEDLLSWLRPKLCDCLFQNQRRNLKQLIMEFIDCSGYQWLLRKSITCQSNLLHSSLLDNRIQNFLAYIQTLLFRSSFVFFCFFRVFICC